MQESLSECEQRTTRTASSEYALLFFRNQQLKKLGPLRVATIFGTLSERGEAPRGMNLVSNLRTRGKDDDSEVTLPKGDRELNLHFDHCFHAYPLRGIVLCGVEIPPEGGDTLFTDMRIIRTISKEIRVRLDGKVIHHNSFT